MSDQGRLIINARGESAKAIAVDKGVRVQVTARIDAMSLHLASGAWMLATDVDADYAWTEACSEIELPKREAAALALQILDAAGYGAEVSATPRGPEIIIKGPDGYFTARTKTR